MLLITPQITEDIESNTVTVHSSRVTIFDIVYQYNMHDTVAAAAS